jgi:hypothetical protein
MPASGHGLAEWGGSPCRVHPGTSGGVEGLARPHMFHRRPAMLLVEPATIDNRRVIIDNKLATFDNSPATFDNKPATIDNRSAIDHSIVKTLYRRRAMKGFYYDESLRRPATHGFIV